MEQLRNCSQVCQTTSYIYWGVFIRGKKWILTKLQPQGLKMKPGRKKTDVSLMTTAGWTQKSGRCCVKIPNFSHRYKHVYSLVQCSLSIANFPLYKNCRWGVFFVLFYNLRVSVALRPKVWIIRGKTNFTDRYGDTGGPHSVFGVFYRQVRLKKVTSGCQKYKKIKTKGLTWGNHKSLIDITVATSLMLLYSWFSFKRC